MGEKGHDAKSRSYDAKFKNAKRRTKVAMLSLEALAIVSVAYAVGLFTVLPDLDFH